MNNGIKIKLVKFCLLMFLLILGTNLESIRSDGKILSKVTWTGIYMTAGSRTIKADGKAKTNVCAVVDGLDSNGNKINNMGPNEGISVKFETTAGTLSNVHFKNGKWYATLTSAVLTKAQKVTVSTQVWMQDKGSEEGATAPVLMDPNYNPEHDANITPLVVRMQINHDVIKADGKSTAEVCAFVVASDGNADEIHPGPDYGFNMKFQSSAGTFSNLYFENGEWHVTLTSAFLTEAQTVDVMAELWSDEGEELLAKTPVKMDPNYNSDESIDTGAGTGTNIDSSENMDKGTGVNSGNALKTPDGNSYIILYGNAPESDMMEANMLIPEDLRVTPAKKTVLKGQNFNINVVAAGGSEFDDLSEEEWYDICERSIDSVVFRSTKSNVAYVSRTGKVTGRKQGSAVIKTTINLSGGDSVTYKTKVYVKKM